MDRGINICSYHWRYSVSIYDEVLHVYCFRHSGPVSKYHSFTRPITVLISKTIRDIVDEELNKYAKENGA